MGHILLLQLSLAHWSNKNHSIYHRYKVGNASSPYPKWHTILHLGKPSFAENTLVRNCRRPTELPEMGSFAPRFDDTVASLPRVCNSLELVE